MAPPPRSTSTLVPCVHTQAAYTRFVKGTFVELPPFERHRSTYLNDDAFLALQNLLMSHPDAGDVIPDTGGLRR